MRSRQCITISWLASSSYCSLYFVFCILFSYYSISYCITVNTPAATAACVLYFCFHSWFTLSDKIELVWLYWCLFYSLKRYNIESCSEKSCIALVWSDGPCVWLSSLFHLQLLWLACALYFCILYFWLHWSGQTRLSSLFHVCCTSTTSFILYLPGVVVIHGAVRKGFHIAQRAL